MKRFCIFLGSTAFSWVGWSLGGHIGFFSAVFLSLVGGVFGVLAGIRFHDHVLH